MIGKTHVVANDVTREPYSFIVTNEGYRYDLLRICSALVFESIEFAALSYKGHSRHLMLVLGCQEANL